MSKVLYLVTMEAIINSGIFENQVKNLIIKAKRQQRMDLLCILSIKYYLLNYKEICSIKNEFKKEGLKFWSVPILIPSRFFFMPILLVPIFILLTLPVLILFTIIGNYKIIHCRSYLSALTTISYKCIVNRGVKVIFDMRGTYPEEAAYLNKWDPQKLNYKLWKRLEHSLVVKSNKIVVVSEGFKKYVEEIDLSASVNVIYANVDLGLYNNSDNKHETYDEIKRIGKKIIVYCGSVGSWHSVDVIIRMFENINKDNKYHLLFINQNQHDFISDRLKSNNILDEHYTITSAKAENVPFLLSFSDIGIVPLVENLDSCYMKIISKTMISSKAQEYISSGLPVITNKNVGGLSDLVRKHNIGICFSTTDYKISNLDELLENKIKISARCKEVAFDKFDIEKNIIKYIEIYNSI